MIQPALADASSLLPAPAGAAPGSLNIVQAMVRVITHHWWKILAIWVVLTAGLVYGIQVRVKPVYEAFSVLRVEPGKQRDLFNLGLNSDDQFERFLKTQVEMIRSPSVINAVLANRDVAATAVVREAADPAAELLGRLQAYVKGETHLIQVSMTLQNPKEAALIVNEVVKAYLNVAADWTTNATRNQIDSLERYQKVLQGKIQMRQKTWKELASKSDLELVEPTATAATAGASTLPHAMPSKVSVEEYRHTRTELYQITMDLIQAEALLQTRQADLKARMDGVDQEYLVKRRVEKELLRDPEVAGLIKDIQSAQERFNAVARRTRIPSDPSRTHMTDNLETLTRKLTKLCDEKRDALTEQFREDPLQDGGSGQSIRQLEDEIASMKVRQATYKDILAKLEVTNRQQGSDAVELALVHEDLGSLRQMEESVMKRIEQLKYDARGEERISQIDPARESRVPQSDKRRKLMAMTPLGVIAVVLGLFLFLEIRSGRVADVEEVSRRVPVEVYAVPSLPGARRTSDQRALRANEIQLQEFLQSLDHLRVSLWFGKEGAAGSGRCLAITSAVGGEGKTTLTAHLAVCCAKAGISTLVIDADLRRGALSRMFEEEQAAGLSDVLKGDMPAEEAVVPLRDGGFHLLPAGTPGQHPGWLFREHRIGQVLERYRQMFDLILVDTPPVLPVPDALSLGRWVDGAVLIIRYDVSRFSLVERARRRLLSAGIPILKTVVNGVRTSRFSGFGYNNGGSYGYSYSGYGDGRGYGERTAAAGPEESSSV
jgi:capsular exopolysaccharide synthesis family protein